jgi:hypothetical protein
MNPDFLKNIRWLLPWGIALFAMMRFGCGMGRHGCHAQRRDL